METIITVSLHSMKEKNIAATAYCDLATAIRKIYHEVCGREEVMREIGKGHCYLEVFTGWHCSGYYWMRPESECGMHYAFAKDRLTFADFLRIYLVEVPFVKEYTLTNSKDAMTALFILCIGGTPSEVICRHTSLPADLIHAVAGDMELTARRFRKTASVTAYVLRGSFFVRANYHNGPAIIPNNIDVELYELFK